MERRPEKEVTRRASFLGAGRTDGAVADVANVRAWGDNPRALLAALGPFLAGIGI